MKSLKIVLLIVLFQITGVYSYSQTITNENTYTIEGKARRGKLAHVELTEGGNYKLYYVTKSTAKKIKFIIYTFDSKFKFKSRDEDEVEMSKVKSKYTWLPFRGELYSVEGISLNFNPVTSLKLKKKRITYKYDWLLLGYHKTVTVLEKIKPRTDDGLKYFAFKYFEDEIDGSITLIVGAAPGAVSKDAGKRITDIRLLKFDKDLNKLGETKIPFKFGQSVAFTQGFYKYDPDNSAAVGYDGGVIVFAPTEWKGSSAPVDKNYGNFTYVEFDKDLKIVSRESFTSPSPGWDMQGMSSFENESGGKDIYIYGSAALGKNKFHQYVIQSAKKKSFQIMKVSNGKVEYITESNIEDIEVVKKTPVGSKKTETYNGKQKVGYSFHLTAEKNVILYGTYTKEGSTTGYTAFQFDVNGKLGVR